MKIAIYQFNPIIGAIESNTDKIIVQIKKAISANCDLFLLPELALCGYPPEDILLREDFNLRINKALEKFTKFKNITLLIPAPFRKNQDYYNSIYVFNNGKLITRYDKQCLPNYGVFDDKRYFNVGSDVCIINIKDMRIGVLICEDIWYSDPIEKLCVEKVDLVCVLNASPFENNKNIKRLTQIQSQAQFIKVPIIYVNSVGGQDELVYDGASFMVDASGLLIKQLPAFIEKLDFIDNFNKTSNLDVSVSYPNYPQNIYQALVIATHDYVSKNGFKKVIIGLSGGIDSALTLAIAVDALGCENVIALMMPSQFTQKISILDAHELLKNLGVKNFYNINIEHLFHEFQKILAPIFINKRNDITEENLQARIRGVLLMAIANKFNYLVLATGNKSELATGYCTLYGDMVGAFAPLKDVLKTIVYDISRWKNSHMTIIPERIITRAPSAELKDNQTDQDSLPDYAILDKIIESLVEKNLSTNTLIKQGFLKDDVLKVAKLIKSSEYKRQQSVVGPKVSVRGFTKDWRYPITNHFDF